jgi:lysophospholipase L1-like esterase
VFKGFNFSIVCFLICISMDITGQTLSQNEPVKFLALGDSYTVGESVAEVQRWPVQLVNVLKTRGYKCGKPAIVAMTGWRTDDLNNALLSSSLSKNFTLVSLLIGVNNQYQGKPISDYEKEFADLLDRAIAYAGGHPSKVFVLSIPDYGYTPFARENQKEISPQIDAFNAINNAVAAGKGVKYINITDISRRGLQDPQLIAEDGLHPSGKMYALWVKRILETL